MEPIGGKRSRSSQNQKPENVAEEDEILKKLEELLNKTELNDMFDEVTERLMRRIKSFCPEFSIDYHVVLINEKEKKRYSILEGKKPTIACKPINYGIVGALIQQKRRKHQSIFVQFKLMPEIPTVAYIDEGKGPEKLEESVISEMLKGNNTPIWDEKKKDFAIAATLIKKNGEKIGACSFDISVQSGVFPDFSFRKEEVEEIFDALYTFKEIFEKFILMEDSTTLKTALEIVGGNIDE